MRVWGTGARALAMLLSGLGVAASAAAAQDGTTSGAGAGAPPLDVAELVAEALSANPEIAAARQRVDAARLRIAQARSLPDPMLSAGWNSSGNPLPGAGLGSEPTANIGVMVTQPLPYPGKRALRAEAATRSTDVAQRELDALEADLRGRVKAAYYELASTVATIGVLERNRQMLDTLRQVSEQRYAVGGAAQQDVFRAQAELTVVELRLERARRDRRMRESELNALLNRAPHTPLGAPPPLALAEVDVPIDTLLAALVDRAPQARRDAAAIAQAEAEVAVARREFKPDLGISAGYYYMGSMPAMYMARLDLELPIRRARRQAALQERLVDVSAARSDRDATRRTLEAGVQQDHQTVTADTRLARIYRDALLPQLRLAFESAIASYQTGSVDFLSVLMTFTSVLDNEMAYYDTLADLHLALARLESATGLPLPH